ncbi:MAG: hypothetical protein GKR77_05110 [Legionellales bacterium]|nr:hypothetical protein [Legionellales bacterium]
MTTEITEQEKRLAQLLAGRKVWQLEETQRLAGLSLMNGYFYWLILRQMCDPITQMVGRDRVVTWSLLSKQFAVWINKILDKQQLRRMSAQLEAAGLVRKYERSNRLEFHLPFATDIQWLRDLLLDAKSEVVTPPLISLPKTLDACQFNELEDELSMEMIPFLIPPATGSGSLSVGQKDKMTPFLIPLLTAKNDNQFNALAILIWIGLMPLLKPLRVKVCIFYLLLFNNKYINIKAHFENPAKKFTPSCRAEQEETNAWFDEFWQVYPVKKSKRRAKTLFVKLVRDEEHFQQIMTAIQAQKDEHERLQMKRMIDKRVFIPAWKYPTTWLSQGCWDDEVSDDSKFSEFTPLSEMFPINADFSQINYGGWDDEDGD